MVGAFWVKFRVFSTLERWKRHARDKITKSFYCEDRVMRSSYLYKIC